MCTYAQVRMRHGAWVEVRGHAARVRACARVSRRGRKHFYPSEPSQQPSVSSFVSKIALDLSGTHSFAHGTWQR